jgi:heptosyltransferase-1
VSERILIVRLSARGDVVQSTPVARALKAAVPDCHLTWAVHDVSAPLLAGNPHIDETLVVARELSVPELLESWWRIKAGEFTTTIDLQGLVKSAVVTHMSGAPRRIGKEEARESAAFAYTELSPERWDQTYISQRYLEQCASFGVDLSDYVPELFLAEEDFGPADELFATEGLGEEGPVVVLVAFSAGPRREWPEERFVTLAGMLRETLGARIIVPGSAGERPRAESLAERMGEGAISFAGRTNLREAAALLQRADLVIGGDTGLTNIAFAVGTPVVCILGHTPVRNGPKGDKARTVYLEDIPCRPCRPRQPCEHRRCLTEIGPEMVFETVSELMTAAGVV